ncbi:MAG TPA: patatin-like phospholipase family protein [Candidatus Saccharimonadia bacterium]|nr:patatin-like phospholipase family protein [Candidatus Saccharimonadia bacterium]
MATFDMVFEGGGAKGTAFVGAMDVLSAAGHSHRRLIGTSAGAITSTLLGAGYSASELLAAVNETLPGTDVPVFTTFMDPPEVTDFSQQVIDTSVTMGLLNRAHLPGLVKNPVVHGLLDIDLYRELFSFTECGGFYAGNAFLTWFRKKLQGKNLDPNITWKNFAQQTGSDVSVVTSDVDEEEMVVLNARTAPGIPVAISVRMSMSIPFVWREIVWDPGWGTYRGRAKSGHTFVDGGVLSNFPIRLIAESDEEIADIMGKVDPTGAGNLGFLLDEKIQVVGIGPSDTRRPRLRTADRVTRLVDTMRGTNDADAMRNHPTAVCRIPVGGIGTTEFRMSKERMAALIESGRQAMRSYLSEHFQ